MAKTYVNMGCSRFVKEMFIYKSYARYRSVASLKEVEKHQFWAEGRMCIYGSPLPLHCREGGGGGGGGGCNRVAYITPAVRQQQLILDLTNPEGCRAEFYQESGSL